MMHWRAVFAQCAEPLCILLQFDFGKQAPMSSPDIVVTLAASRHLYETTLRSQVLGINNIRTRTAAHASGLVYDQGAKQVKGMRLSKFERLVNSWLMHGRSRCLYNCLSLQSQ